MTIMNQKYTTCKNRPYIIHCTDNEHFTFPYHWHDEVELLYVLEGNITFVIGSQTYHVKERDILIIKSGEVHRCYDGIKYKAFVVEFAHYLDNDIFKTQVLMNPAMPDIIKPRNINNNGQTPDKEINEKYNIHKELEELFLEIGWEYKNQKQSWDFIIKSAIYRIIALLDREYSNKLISENKIMSQNYNEILQEVFDFIDDNYNTDIEVEDVAKMAHFSKHYFNKFFKKVTNKTLSRYINDIRLEKAKALLMGSNHRITDISFDIGFNSVKTFNRIFKEKTGYTPSEYRHMNSVKK